MDGLQFIASIVKSLAWPAAVVLCVFLLRAQLSTLLLQLRRLKYGDLQMEFEKGLSTVEAEATKLPTLPKPISDERSEQRFQLAADLNPNFAVLEAWLNVETALAATAQEAGIDTRRSPLYIARTLLKADRIDERTAAILDELRMVRNLTVHPRDEGSPITIEQARRFKKLADTVVAALGNRQSVRPASPPQG